MFGILNSSYILLLLITLFSSHYLIGLNPYSIYLHIIRVLSCIIICVIIYLESDSYYLMQLLLPFSVNKIDYVHDFNIKSLNYYKLRGWSLNLKDLHKDLDIFLKNLNENDNYWLSFNFYTSIEAYMNEEGIRMNISDPIIINRESSPLLLNKFIMNRLNTMTDLYYLDDSIINSKDPVIILSFTEIEIE